MAAYRMKESVDIFAYEDITVSTTSIGLTTATYKPSGRTRAVYALITSETAGLRFTMDGTTPTASLGHAMAAGSSLELEGPNNISRFRAIRSGGSDATLRVSYGR